ncbi:MAG: hypothetical protein ACAH59_00775 [Pseudobdellovibrionaceae bacterium]
MTNLDYQKIGLSQGYVIRLGQPARQLVHRLLDEQQPKADQDPWSDLPPSTELFVRRVFKVGRLKVASSFWETLKDNYGFELWSSELEYVVGCGKFLSLTSYSQEELLSTPWNQLFERDPIHIQQLLTAFQRMMETQEPQFNVTPFHVVKETQSVKKVSLMVAIRAIYPFYFEEMPNTPAGAVALTEFKPLSS